VYGFSTSWILLIVVSTVLGLGTQFYISSTFRRWSQVPCGGLTGPGGTARLAANGVVSDGVVAAPWWMGAGHVKFSDRRKPVW
jgi:Zn-dependent membrane protease YugP